jgi:hypothetical protein
MQFPTDHAENDKGNQDFESEKQTFFIHANSLNVAIPFATENSIMTEVAPVRNRWLIPSKAIACFTIGVGCRPPGGNVRYSALALEHAMSYHFPPLSATPT